MRSYIKIGDSYVATKNDIEIARHMSDIQCKVAIENGHVQTPQGDSQSCETHLWGVLGELAFCMLTGCIFNMNPPKGNRSSLRGTDPFDTRWRGHTVDVKALSGSGIKTAWVEFPPDYYALMRQRFPRFTYMGCIEGVELMQDRRRVENFGNKKMYRAWEGDLIVMPPKWKGDV